MIDFIIKQFTILEIKPTNNVREVKKAYAKAIKKYHPEDNSEEWKKVHSAYTIILDYLKNNSVDESEEMDLEDDSKEKVKKIFIEKIIGNSATNSDKSDSDISSSEEDLLEEILANKTEDVTKEKYARFSSILSKIKNIVLTDILVENKHVVTMDSFQQLREDPLYKDALHYEYFLSKLSAVFEKTIIDPQVYTVVRADIASAISYLYEASLKPQYDRLLRVIKKNLGDDTLKDAIKKAESSIENESIRLKNAKSRKFEKTIWIIGILTSIVMIIMHSRTKNGPRSRR